MQRTQNINENNDVSGVHVNRFDSSESVDDSEVARGIGERRIRAITGIDLLDRMLYSLQVSDINWINSLKKSFLFLLFISIPLLFVLNPIQRDVVPSVSGLESNVGNYFHDKYEYVRNMVQEVKNRALNFFRESKDKARDKVDQAEDKMDRMKTRAKEFMEDKKDYLNDKKEHIKEDVHEAKERTKDYLRDKKDRVRDRFEDEEERSRDRKDREERWGSRDQSRERDDQDRDRQSRDREDSKESDRVRNLERGISRDTKDRHDTKERDSRDTRDRKDIEESRDVERDRDVHQHDHLDNHYPDDFMPSDRFADSGSDIRADVSRPPIRDIRQYAREHHVDLGEYDPNYVESDVEQEEGRSSQQQQYTRNNRRSSQDQYDRDRSDRDHQYDRDRNYERDRQYDRDRSDRERSDRDRQYDRRSDYREDERDWERRSSDRDTRDRNTRDTKDTRDRDTRDTRDTRDRVRDVVDEEIPKAVHRVKETKDQVVDKVADKLEDAKDYLKEKKDQVVDKLGDAKDYLKEKKDEVIDFIKEEAPEVKDYIKEKKDQVVDKLGDAKDYLKEKKDQVVDYFEEEKEDVKRYAKDKKDQAVDKLEDTKKRTKDYVRDKKDQAVDYVDEKINDFTNQKPRSQSRSRRVEEEDKHYESNYRYDSHKDTYVDKNNKNERQRQYESKSIFTKKDDERKNVDDSNLESLVTKTSAAVVFKQPFTSSTYARFTFKTFFVNVLSHVIGGKDVFNFPANALSDNMEIGHCFSFEGSRGNITIDLKSPVTVKAVSLEHPQTGHLESSPKRFSVFAFNARSLDQLVHYRNSGAEIGSNLIFPKGTVGPKIFEVEERETRFLQFRFLENNGDPEYTCVYRINVLVERP